MLDKGDQTAGTLELLKEQDLMDILAGQAIRRGDDHLLELACGDPLTQPVEAWSCERGAAEPVVAKDVLGLPTPALGGTLGLDALQLLGDSLGLDLLIGRHPDVLGYAHNAPPLGSSPGRWAAPTGGEVDRPGPSAASHLGLGPGCAAVSTLAVVCSSLTSCPVRSGLTAGQ